MPRRPAWHGCPHAMALCCPHEYGRCRGIRPSAFFRWPQRQMPMRSHEASRAAAEIPGSNSAFNDNPSICAMTEEDAARLLCTRAGSGDGLRAGSRVSVTAPFPAWTICCAPFKRGLNSRSQLHRARLLSGDAGAVKLQFNRGRVVAEWIPSVRRVAARVILRDDDRAGVGEYRGLEDFAWLCCGRSYVNSGGIRCTPSAPLPFPVCYKSRPPLDGIASSMTSGSIPRAMRPPGRSTAHA